MLLPPINFIFKLLQQHSTVQIWLYEQVRLSLREFCHVCQAGKLIQGVMVQLGIRIEGKIRGFDEFMNLVVSPTPDPHRNWDAAHT